MANMIRSDNEAGDLYDPPSYMHLTEYSGVMTAHIIFMLFAWVFALPVGVVFSIVGHRYAVVMRFIFLSLNGLGLIFGIIVNTKTADLYKGNAHHTIGWVTMGMVVFHALIDMLLRFAKRKRTNHATMAESTGSFLYLWIKTIHQSMYTRRPDINDSIGRIASPNSDRDIAHASQQRSYEKCQCSDSGYNDDDDNSYSSSTNCGSSSSSSYDDDDDSDDDEDDMSEDEYKSFVPFHSESPRTHFIHGYFTHRFPTSALPGLMRTFEISYKVIDWTILVVGYVTLMTGGVTYAGIFRGSHVFNGVAHFVKGGIFFWYGLLTLGRWLGCFSDVGWAWNIKPPCMTNAVLKASTPSAEFVESFVIFLYGSSNMFLEHLAGWGKAWTVSDLEHVSISILFFGGGLCGMLVESKAIRKLLNFKTERRMTVVGSKGKNPVLAQLPQEDMHTLLPRTYDSSSPGSSTNTVPALVILLLGIIMSSHHQSSMLSTTIHKQWGMLLSGFAVMRILTYIVMYIMPATSVFPSRPPSELIASFCLIAGGIVFMASAADVVQLMESNGLMAMFVFTVAMGLTALVMAWEIVVLSLKGWAERSNARRCSSQNDPDHLPVPTR